MRCARWLDDDPGAVVASRSWRCRRRGRCRRPLPAGAADDGECTVTTTVRCTGAAAPYARAGSAAAGAGGDAAAAAAAVAAPPPPRRAAAGAADHPRPARSSAATAGSVVQSHRRTAVARAQALDRLARQCGAPGWRSGSAATPPASSAATAEGGFNAASRRWPIIGAFVNAGVRTAARAQVLWAVDGLAQAGGFVTFLVGLAAGPDKMERLPLTVGPTASPAAARASRSRAASSDFAATLARMMLVTSRLLERACATASPRAAAASPTGRYATLNVGGKWGDDPEHVAHNRRRLAAAGGFDWSRLFTAKQVHGARVALVVEGTLAERVAETEADVVATARARRGRRGLHGRLRAHPPRRRRGARRRRARRLARHRRRRGQRGRRGAGLDRRATRAAARRARPVDLRPLLRGRRRGRRRLRGARALVGDSPRRRQEAARRSVGGQSPRARRRRRARGVIDAAPPCTMCEPERFFSFRRDGAGIGQQLSFVAAASARRRLSPSRERLLARRQRRRLEKAGHARRSARRRTSRANGATPMSPSPMPAWRSTRAPSGFFESLRWNASRWRRPMVRSNSSTVRVVAARRRPVDPRRPQMLRVEADAEAPLAGARQHLGQLGEAAADARALPGGELEQQTHLRLGPERAADVLSARATRSMPSAAEQPTAAPGCTITCATPSVSARTHSSYSVSVERSHTAADARRQVDEVRRVRRQRRASRAVVAPRACRCARGTPSPSARRAACAAHCRDERVHSCTASQPSRVARSNTVCQPAGDRLVRAEDHTTRRRMRASCASRPLMSRFSNARPAAHFCRDVDGEAVRCHRGDAVAEVGIDDACPCAHSSSIMRPGPGARKRRTAPVWPPASTCAAPPSCELCAAVSASPASAIPAAARATGIPPARVVEIGHRHERVIPIWNGGSPAGAVARSSSRRVRALERLADGERELDLGDRLRVVLRREPARRLDGAPRHRRQRAPVAAVDHRQEQVDLDAPARGRRRARCRRGDSSSSSVPHLLQRRDRRSRARDSARPPTRCAARDGADPTPRR